MKEVFAIIEFLVYIPIWILGAIFYIIEGIVYLVKHYYIPFVYANTEIIKLSGASFLVVALAHLIYSFFVRKSEDKLTIRGWGIIALIVGASLLYCGLIVPPLTVFVFIASGIYGLVAYFVMPKILDKSVSQWIDRDNNPEIVEMVEEISQKMGITPPQKIGITKHKGLNAFTYGPSNKDARIVIHEDLLKVLPNYALKGVLAHELGHIKNEDFRLTSLIIFMPQAALTLMLLTFAIPLFILLLLIIALFVAPFIGSGGKDKDGSSAIGGVFLGIVVMVYIIYHIGIWSFLLALVVIPTYLWYCRTREYLADKRTIDVGLSPFSLLDALVIINYYTEGYNNRYENATKNGTNIVRLKNEEPFSYCWRVIASPVRRLAISDYNGIGWVIEDYEAQNIYENITRFFENNKNKKKKLTSIDFVAARFKELVDQGILNYPSINPDPGNYNIDIENVPAPKNLAKGEEYNLKSYIYDRIREGKVKPILRERIASILSTHPIVLVRIINVMNAEKEKGNGKKGFSS